MPFSLFLQIYMKSKLKVIIVYMVILYIHTHTHIRTQAHAHIHTYSQLQGSPFEVQTTTQWNLMGRSITAPPTVLSPAVFFHLSHSALTPLRENSVRLVSVAISSFTLPKLYLKLRELKCRKSGCTCMYVRTYMPTYIHTYTHTHTHTHIQQNSNYPDADYPDLLGPSGKFVENSTKLTFLEITGYRVKYSTASRTSNQTWPKGLDAGASCKQ